MESPRDDSSQDEPPLLPPEVAAPSSPREPAIDNEGNIDSDECDEDPVQQLYNPKDANENYIRREIVTGVDKTKG